MPAREGRSRSPQAHHSAQPQPMFETRALFVRRRGRFLAYALALGMLALVSVVYTVGSWSRAVARHDRDLQTRVVMGSAAVNAYLTAVEQSFADLSDRLLEGDPRDDLQPLLARYKQHHPEFELVSVIGMAGEPIAASSGRIGNAAGTAFFTDARERILKGERMVISRPYLGRTIPKTLIQLRYGVRDASGQLRYTVGASIPVEHAQSFWKDVPLPEGADMGLLREDLYAIARYPVPAKLGAAVYDKPQPGLLSEYLIANSFPRAGMVRGYAAALGKQTAVAFQRLSDYPIYFVTTSPREILMREWWNAAWPTYVLLLLLFAGGMSLVQWLGRRQAEAQQEREARLTELEYVTGELSRHQVELENTMARLESTNAELEAYMYSVSHDLRAPIRAIDGFTALLAEDLALAPDSEPARLLERIRASTARMTTLLADLLNLSRYSIQELRKEKIDPRPEIEAVLAELGYDRARVRIQIDALPEMLGDRVLLRQVWSNLIGNALKYSARAAQPAIQIAFENGAYVVRDNGVGFDVTYADKLFKLFSRLHSDQEYPGTGVGLAIVKRIVERHEGTIRAAGKPGEGAVFSFSLPD
jgi:signal transduction histidine kinase